MNNFCTSCGSRLENGSKFCTMCGAGIKENKKRKSYCTGCGKELESNAYFCTSCGKQVNNNLSYINMNRVELPVSNNIPVGKSRNDAIILAFVLGVFGAHNFYLGYYPKAILQLCLTICSLFIFSPMIFLWGVVEGFLILTNNIDKDANGNPLVS